MSATDDTPPAQNRHANHARYLTSVRDVLRQPARTIAVAVGFLVVVATDPALAQSTGDAFCQTTIAETIKNLFTLIQFGGPLLGGVLALGATVMTPAVRNADRKREITEIRNQGLVWGVIVAPLGSTIIQFIMNNVVAGGTSCAF